MSKLSLPGSSSSGSKTRALFRAVKPEAITDNPFRLIDREWMLITAGAAKRWNTMTASWGGLGVLWNRPVAFCFVRPTRYTYEFMERADCFTLSFFSKEYRKALAFCGSHSGRDIDKASATGLIPIADRKGHIYFQQARMVLLCRKLSGQDIDPENFYDQSILKLYPKRDFHRMYIGAITQVLIRSSQSPTGQLPSNKR